MELMNKIRKSRKGFTLVEIIVVLVILAILAAFTIPAMLGFVGDARAKAYLAEAREVYTAAQATATEYSAKYTFTSTALSTALSSDAVQNQSAAPNALTATATATEIATYNSALASYQMNKYLKNDLDISDSEWVTSPTSTTYAHGKSAWKATVDTNGKVTEIIYIKNSYKTTVYGDGKDPITTKID